MPTETHKKAVLRELHRHDGSDPDTAAVDFNNNFLEFLEYAAAMERHLGWLAIVLGRGAMKEGLVTQKEMEEHYAGRDIPEDFLEPEAPSAQG